MLSPFIEVGISLVFIYLLMSILVSNLNELRTSLRNIRGKRLQEALNELLNDGRANKNFAYLLYNHPLVEKTKRSPQKLPAYIATDVFTQTLISLISDEAPPATPAANTTATAATVATTSTAAGSDNRLSRFIAGINELNDSELKRFLATIADQAGNFNELKVHLGSWYENYMDRVSGWYKISMSKWLWWLGLGATLILNVNTITISKELLTNATLRDAVAAAAEAFAAKNDTLALPSADWKATVQSIKQTNEELNMLQLPIGWKKGAPFSEMPRDCSGWIWQIVGWLITATAISFGAPFWFDVLKKAVNIRRAGNRPENLYLPQKP